MMKLLVAGAILSLLAVEAAAFTPQSSAFSRSGSVSLNLLKDESEKSMLEKALGRELEYKPAQADTDFARKYSHLKGAEIRTVGATFTEFTNMLGSPVNALYKSMIADLCGSTHLTVVCARFRRDPIWSLGIISSLDMLLKNYPDIDIRDNIRSCLFKANGMDESEVRAEAETVASWAKGKSRAEIESALKGEGGGPVATTAVATSGDEFWMYSRYFGLGLVKMMEGVGIEQNADDTYPVMEEWMGKCLGKPHYTACSDSDLYFRIKGKLDIMETMMKEIEIREKKRMAQRLEDKADAAIRKAERDVQFQAEKTAEAQE